MSEKRRDQEQGREQGGCDFPRLGADRKMAAPTYLPGEEPTPGVTYIYSSEEEEVPVTGHSTLQRIETNSDAVGITGKAGNRGTSSWIRKHARDESEGGENSERVRKVARVEERARVQVHAGGGPSRRSRSSGELQGKGVMDEEDENGENSSPTTVQDELQLRDNSGVASLSYDKAGKGNELARKGKGRALTIERSGLQRVPAWLKDAVVEVKESFPGARIRSVTGPGESLHNMKKHLMGSQHGLCPTVAATNSSGSQASGPTAGIAASGSHLAGNGALAHPVAMNGARTIARFLEEVGLTEDLADALIRVGIKDEARIRVLGQLPESLLDKLDESLADEGLDCCARLLVRYGLKRRATGE
ncbi:hypothetical protein L227DRAFT_567084 [Lentinus tigrinus ALCF2SS1-6]|uniref:Uncharacterized protein n=1 Tax=Lentinus tigrinus ALCF2SS1-6 TaxID=1328759 RepID=A0A5C2RU11_9APHY|nr:hypothetical protein L227DRAFT_567084 [Lentinus tigrinus ALCF2SS1-6]